MSRARRVGSLISKLLLMSAQPRAKTSGVSIRCIIFVTLIQISGILLRKHNPLYKFEGEGFSRQIDPALL